MVCFSRSPVQYRGAPPDKRFNWKDFATQLHSSGLDEIPSGQGLCAKFNQNGTKEMRKICEDEANVCQAYFWTGTGPQWNIEGDCTRMCATQGLVCEEAWDQLPGLDTSCERFLDDPRRTGNGCLDRYNNQICRCIEDRAEDVCENMQAAFADVGRPGAIKQNCQSNNTTHPDACEALFWSGGRTCSQQCDLAGMQCVYGYDQVGNNGDGNAVSGPGACERNTESQVGDGCEMQFQTQICACEFPPVQLSAV